MGYTPAGYADTGGSAMLPFSRRQRLDRAAAGARSDSRQPCRAPAPRISSPRGSTTAQLDRPDASRCASGSAARWCAPAISAIRPRHAESSRLCARCATLTGARARGCVLACWNMMIPYLLPGAARSAEGGAALAGQDAAGLYQRGVAQLDGLQALGIASRLCAGLVSLVVLPEPDGRYRRLSQPAHAERADTAPHGAHAVQARPAGARAEQGRAG